MLNLVDVLEALGHRDEVLFRRLSAWYVANFVIDSREAAKGDLFIALHGERTDGHKYLSHAIGRGVIAAIVEDEIDAEVLQDARARLIDLRMQAKTQTRLAPQPALGNQEPQAEPAVIVIRVDSSEAALQRIASAWRRKFDALRVVGVTGSIGKTSTKELIAQVLSVRFNTLKSEGNLNNALGVPLSLLRLMPQHEVAVLEMGMDRLGEITSYCRWAQPQIGVITNVGPVHLENLGSIENIALAKSELVEALPANGVAILNNDDARVRAMRKVSRARVLTYGLSAEADVWADDVTSLGLDGISLVLHYKDDVQRVRVPLLGMHSAQTVLRAAASGFALGMGMADVVDGLMLAVTEQLRLVVAKGPRDSLVIDDTYNASAASTIAALNVLKDLDEKPKIAVLGDMLELGSAERESHEEVGCRAAVVADYLIGVGVRALWICNAAVECGMDRARVTHVLNNIAALAVLRNLVKQRSAILVKGSRGMKMEEIVEGLGGMQK